MPDFLINLCTIIIIIRIISKAYLCFTFKDLTVAQYSSSPTSVTDKRSLQVMKYPDLKLQMKLLASRYHQVQYHFYLYRFVVLYWCSENERGPHCFLVHEKHQIFYHRQCTEDYF